MTDTSEIPRNIGPGDQIVPEDETFSTPDLEDVFREDDSKPDAPPLQVINSPNRMIGLRTFQISTTVAQRILDDDPRRATATIIPIDTDIRLGNDLGSAQSTGGTRLPMGVPLLVTSCDELWACAVTIACEVSVISEYWAR